MNEQLSLVVTGASGFIGRYFLMAAMQQFKMYCLARRSQAEVDVPHHPNIVWMQTDIGDGQQMEETASLIRKQGGAEAVLHLAGYYDFSLQDHPAYDKTNVQGTRNTLDLARSIGARHFIFSSSLAACAFTPPGVAVSEATPCLQILLQHAQKIILSSKMVDFMQLLEQSMVRALENRPELESIHRDVSGYLELTLQYCVDEIRDVFEQLPTPFESDTRSWA